MLLIFPVESTHFHILGSVGKDKSFSNILLEEEDRYLKALFHESLDTIHQATYDYLVQDINFATTYLDYSQATNPNLEPFHKHVFGQMLSYLGQKEDLPDVALLYEHNACKVANFINAMWFVDYLPFLKEFMDFRFKWKTGHENKKVLMSMIEANHGLLLSNAYEDAYTSPWASSAAIEMEHLKLFKSVEHWISQISGNQVDKVLFVLMSLILILDRSTCLHVSNKINTAEEVQVKYVRILYKYLKSKPHLEGVAYSYLHKGLMLAQDTERIQELSNQKLILDL